MRDDELPALTPAPTEIALAMAVLVALFVIMPAVFVASYRRNRCLFGRSVAESVAIGLVSAIFWPVWVVASILTYRLVAARWAEQRDAKAQVVPGGMG